MALLRNGRPATDAWTHAADDETLPAGPATVSLARWQAERTSLLERNAPLGLRLQPADEPEAIGDDVGRFGLICVDFPSFTDGRGYSQARLLRERLGYRGELRATGDVLRDQFLFLHRCGFDSVDARKPADAAAWHDAVKAIAVDYQPAGDRAPTAAMYRRGASSIVPA